MSFGVNHIKDWQQETAVLGAEDRLRWVADRFPNQTIFASALGAEDQVIIDLMARLRLDIPVVTLDTGRWFAETYALLAKTEVRYGIRFLVQFPDRNAVESMVAANGINLFRESVDKRKLCCRVRKIEPLKRALAGFNGWICGLRRDQSVTRSEVTTVDWDDANQLIKINPLADWNERQVWEYIARHDVPYNELHDRGFPSIGCACCTRAISRTEDIRAGRWWWEKPEQKECGLHWVDGKPSKGGRRE
jgi:phosphoadenosine phosphosulfate reductase